MRIFLWLCSCCITSYVSPAPVVLMTGLVIIGVGSITFGGVGGSTIGDGGAALVSKQALTCSSIFSEGNVLPQRGHSMDDLL